MPEPDQENAPDSVGGHVEMNFRAAEFPSDVLSVRRLRVLFPGNFDGPGFVGDNYVNNNFFYPSATERPEHLVRLNDLICDERTVASAAFYEQYLSNKGGLDKDLRDVAADSKVRLAEGLQFFKLAADPEMASLLVKQVEEEGRAQAVARLGRGK